MTKTRAERAEAVRKMIENGPTFSVMDRELTMSEIKQRYKLWAQSWILPEIDTLIPELRK